MGSALHSSTLRGMKTAPGTRPFSARWTSERISTIRDPALVLDHASAGWSRRYRERARSSRSSTREVPWAEQAKVRLPLLHKRNKLAVGVADGGEGSTAGGKDHHRVNVRQTDPVDNPRFCLGDDDSELGLDERRDYLSIPDE